MPSLEAVVASLIGDDLQSPNQDGRFCPDCRITELPLYYPLTTTLTTPNIGCNTREASAWNSLGKHRIDDRLPNC